MEETREQQQMYSMFRSCIYLILIIEIVMNLPITSDNRMVTFVLELFHRFKVFDSVAVCKVMELICITVTCIGTEMESQDDGALSRPCRSIHDRRVLHLL